MSTGIKGFRIGTGPRGNYVHMGRGGIYFRQTLPSFGGRKIHSEIPGEQTSSIAFSEIESGSVGQMVDSSSAALLEEINAKFQKMQFWPWVLGVSVCLLILLAVANSPLRAGPENRIPPADKTSDPAREPPLAGFVVAKNPNTLVS